MDSQHLQDSADSSEEVRGSERGARGQQQQQGIMRRDVNRPPSATGNLRRISTETGGSTDRHNRNLANTPDDIHLDMNMPSSSTGMNTNIMPEDASAFAFTTAGSRSHSWESQSDNEDRGGGINARSSSRTSVARDQRKFDMTTPTLIDEEDEGFLEEEMYALHTRSRQQQSQQQQHYYPHQPQRYEEQQRGLTASTTSTTGGVMDDNVHRRTPGASMYKSSFQEDQFLTAQTTQGHAGSTGAGRRTPGPLDVIRSTSGGGATSSTSMLSQQHQEQQYHQHQHQQQQQQVDDSGLLGFGLTLSSPVATGNRPVIDNVNTRGSAWDLQPPTSSSNPAPPRPSSSSEHSHAQAQQQQPNRPPRAPGAGQPQQQSQQQQSRGDFTFTPWSQGGGQFQANRPGACSPNTLRLTADLGSLLFDADEDSTDQTNQYAFRGGSGQQQQQSNSGAPAESWTSSYVFKTEQPAGGIPSRVPKSSMGRGGRRGSKIEGSHSRRSRGQDRSAAGSSNDPQRQYQVASFLQNAQQPTPVRGTHMQTQMPVSSQNNPFLSDGFDASNVVSDTMAPRPPVDNAAQQMQHQHQDQQQVQQQGQFQQQPKFFNFGGAFAPPAKDAPVGFRPPAPAPVGEQMPPQSGGASLFMGQPQVHLPPGSSNFGDTGPQSSGPFQSQSFQPLPPMAGASRDSPYQHPFPSPNPGYANTAVSPNPAFGLPRTSPYPQQQLMGMHANAHEFYPMAAPHPPLPQHHLQLQQRAPVQQFQQQQPVQQFQPQQQQQPPPSQRWSTSTPNQLSSNLGQPSWPGTTAGWTSGDYVYGGGSGHPSQPPGMENRMGMSPAPPQAQSWLDQGTEYPSNPSPNIFGAAPPAHLQGPTHPLPAMTPSPVFVAPAATAPPQSRREQPQAQPQQQGRQKPNRKPRTSKPGKPDRSKKTEPAAASNPRKPTPVNPSERSSSTTGKKKKHSKGRDSQTPDAASVCSTPSNVPTPANAPGEEGALSILEDPANLKKSELIESPATRSAFKDFYRRFRSEERTSFQGAEGFAIQSLGDGSLPGKVHWRVYLELADLAKRSNRFADARRLYQQVCQLQPYASQGWLEYSKLEEECGHLNRGARILRAGLEYCEYSENLLTRAIKHEEKMGNTHRARELLARLKHVGIEKVWRTVLEGALLEARAGNVLMARRVLKYLMHHVPWYGPLYLEAYRLERDLGRTREALEVVERGLTAIPRYGPLWFGAFRLCEEIDISEREFDLPRTMAMIDRATSSISKELIWKVHLDAAQMLERASLDLRALLDQAGEVAESGQFKAALALCRSRFAMTILNCPPNLRWKVWLAAGRMEIAVGNTGRARRLFLRAHRVVPDKGRATTLLECARLEEFTGDFDLANAILCKSRKEYGTDWKVWLESVLLEIRGGEHARAIELAQGALAIHPGTGRLWAALVQLRFFVGGEVAQFVALKEALNAVPKSGEVWCEGGRIHLNPFSHTFNLERTRRHLFFATKFTPQYGDSFLESLRLELLEQWIAPMASIVWDASKSHFFDSENTDLQDALSNYIFNLAVELASVCREENTVQVSKSSTERPKMLNASIVASIREQLEAQYRESSVDLSDLELRCANADPNYGLLWFHCRHGPTDTARRILDRASDMVVRDLRRFVHIYMAAIIRHSALMGMITSEEGKEEGALLPSIQDDAGWEDLVDERLLAAPSLYDILHDDEEKNREKGVVFLENTMAGSTFATGLAELNRHQPIGDLSLNDRRKALFGTDALFS